MFFNTGPGVLQSEQIWIFDFIRCQDVLENITKPFVLIGSKRHNYETLVIKVIVGVTRGAQKMFLKVKLCAPKQSHFMRGA